MLIGVALGTVACTEHKSTPQAGVQLNPPADMRAYKDPVTGRFIQPPPGTPLPPSPPAATSATGVVTTPGPAAKERPAPAPGGGVMIEFPAERRALDGAQSQP